MRAAMVMSAAAGAMPASARDVRVMRVADYFIAIDTPVFTPPTPTTPLS
jgi:hypothetical protein